jgi:hypothetical protein
LLVSNATAPWNPAAVTAAVDAEISSDHGVESVLHATRLEIASAGADLERVTDVGDGAGVERTDDPR